MSVNGSHVVVQRRPLEERIQDRLAQFLAPGPDQVQVVYTHVDPDEAEVTDQHRYCPAPVPCLGRPAVGLSVPVRASTSPDRPGEVVGRAQATYCPLCKQWRPEGEQL